MEVGVLCTGLKLICCVAISGKPYSSLFLAVSVYLSFAPLWVSGWNENKASPVIFVHLFLQPNHVACGILVPDRDETCSGSLKPEVLTAGTAREILKAGPL